ncbi:hypothetical protein VZ52_19605 [Ralstonia mannitolilytica]|nr:hypothetical protein VZ52_19605 [Ralstonia mannitolilytica]
MFSSLHDQGTMRLRRDSHLEFAAVRTVSDWVGDLLAIRFHVVHRFGNNLANTSKCTFGRGSKPR